MNDVVIIGGGLSGLAAARELQQLKIPYRLIEVKRRLGGSIISEKRDGFVLDGGGFAFPRDADWSFLPELGLEDILFDVSDDHPHTSVAFKEGTQSLIDAMAQSLTGTFIHRMAVSSIGQVEKQFALCMENGLIFEARAVIVAAPARHAERMFRTLQPDVSLRLFDYGYDTITRVSLGFRKPDLALPLTLPWDMAAPFYYWTDNGHRVPSDHVLLHIGVRFPLEKTTTDVLIQHVLRELRPAAAPIISRADFWPEADPIPPHTPSFAQNMSAIQAMLPEGIALAGSDYAGLSLAARIESGRMAAGKIAAFIGSRS
jgi:protoporphyrinogen oxidase